MKTLEIGENIKLGEFGRTFVLSTNSDSLYLMNGSTVVGQIYDGMVIDLNSYLAQAIKNLEIVCVQDKVKPVFLAILKDETPICKYTVDTLKVGSKTVLGKFYFYTTNEWRYRALDSDATEHKNKVFSISTIAKIRNEKAYNELKVKVMQSFKFNKIMQQAVI